MTPQAELKRQESVTASSAGVPPTAERLTNADEIELLQFLEEHPLHNVVMSGFVRDNGVESDLNRGTFYAARNDTGDLKGAALIGHAIFIDARNDDARKSLAQVARYCDGTHVIMGEHQAVELFWQHYHQDGRMVRCARRQVLFEMTAPAARFSPMTGLCPAQVDDLALVVPVHAALACAESGINPLAIDPQGFQMRCRRRIEQGRVWILVERDELIFKADVISETPQVTYIEGVYVKPEKRHQGYGSRCMSQMARCLLDRTNSISVLVNEEQREARRFFQRIGFVPRALYQTIFCK